ncbi:DUF488 domain-containing protein [Dongia deserti]|uniref:DUF488 domain-containing protein n=1 Tax=Dongia deserti TaxID=2268030 RepID=UPI002548FA83|nr:DUF488 domain-containing protein [Dongia deserti]
MSAMIYTIGHSNHSALRFIDLPRGAGIACVADVRSTPFSRRNPQFSQKALAASLKDAGIEYWFLGDALGARPKDPGCYEHGKVSYTRIAATPAFQEAINALIDESHAKRTALMCAEKEPLDCHRTILVGRALAQRDTELGHILADGRIEPHAELEERLLHIAKEHIDLLSSRDAALARAYDKRGQQMAFSLTSG